MENNIFVEVLLLNPTKVLGNILSARAVSYFEPHENAKI